MIPDFKGHHFVEDLKANQQPSEHHCERCGMKAVLTADGSIKFHASKGVLVEINGKRVPLDTSPVPPCKGLPD